MDDTGFGTANVLAGLGFWVVEKLAQLNCTFFGTIDITADIEKNGPIAAPIIKAEGPHHKKIYARVHPSKLLN